MANFASERPETAAAGLDAGRVVEAGTPAELVARGGRFATYWDDRRASERWTLAGAHQAGPGHVAP